MLCRSICVAVILANVVGCGFHLRTYSFGSSVESYAIAGRTQLSIGADLRRALTQAGLNEVPASEAALVVELLDQRRDRRSISVAGRTRAAEYETSLGVHYRIMSGAGEELAAPTWIERERVYRIDSANIVGSSEEQALLEREMLQDVVGQIVRAMDAVSRNLENSNAG